METIPTTPYEEIWGYKWICECGFTRCNALPKANVMCARSNCKKPMKHVTPPQAKTRP